MGRNATFLMPDPFPLVHEDHNDGGYGFGLTYLAEKLNDTEFGFYYVNYNDKLPTTVLPNAAGTSLVAGYQPDIDLYGISFGTVFGNVNVSGEAVLKKDYLLGLNDGSFKAHDYMAYLVSGLFNLKPISR